MGKVPGSSGPNRPMSVQVCSKVLQKLSALLLLSALLSALLLLSTLLLIPLATAFPESLDASDPALDIYFDTMDGANLGWRSGDKAGSALASGDLDGDGLADLVIGSPYGVSEVNTQVDSGVISIVFGTSLAVQKGSLDLSLAGSRIFGNVSGQLLGSCLWTADVTGDGLDDIIAGAPGYGTPLPGETEPSYHETDQGSFYVIPGRPREGFKDYSSIDDASRFYCLGAVKNQQLGRAVCSGDINGDGVEDVIVSAPEKDPLSSTGRWGGAGKAYVFYGGDTLPRGHTGTDEADLRLFGASAGEGAGYSLAAADVNSDGFDDVFLGAPYYAPYLVARETGRIYGMFGGAAMPGVFNLTDADLIITGDETESRFGNTLACGDFDLDGTSDLAASAPVLDAGPRDKAGMVYVFNGGSGLSGAMNPRMNQYSFTGGAAGDQAGTSLAFVRFAGGRDYLAAGCPTGNGSTFEGVLRGRMFLLECRTGRSTGGSTLPESAQHVLFGAADGDLFGTAVCSVLVGGSTGVWRLVAGASEADGADGTRPDSGVVYLFRQSPKQSGDGGGSGGPGGGPSTSDPAIDVPSGFTWRQGGVFLALVLVMFVVFIGFLFYRFRKGRAGLGSDGDDIEGGNGRG